MIEINNIEKSFGKLKVLKKVSLTLGGGKVYAFLGPNGSGKTTLIKCLLGLVKPEKGEILIDKVPICNEGKYREIIGYMPQIARFPENLKVEELFKMIKNIRKQASSEELLIPYFGLEGALQHKLKNLSGGMKQKVNAILSLMFDPEILVLDEPSVGLDPISHIKLKELIMQERNKEKTVLLTTHIISDVEELADEIIFLMDGKVFFQGTPEELRESQNEDKLDKAIARMTNSEEFDSIKLKPKKAEAGSGRRLFPFAIAKNQN